jgi:dehydration protein DpgD
MTDPAVLVERRADATWLTINRPQAMNALNSEAYAAIIGALRAAEADDAVRTVILTGAGGRAFCAGADLKELARYDADGADPDAGPGQGMGGTQAFAALRSFTKPLIAAIDGYCFAGGLEIAALCDLRAATEGSTFRLPEARLGLLPDPGLVELTRLIPLGEALHLQLAARPLTAARAYDIGLVQLLAPSRPALLAAVEELAADIALGAPLAVEAYKEVSRIGRDLPIAEAARLRDAKWAEIARTEDRLEGPRAFAEKRAPRWKRR